MARRDPESGRISSVTHDGRGIPDIPGKKVFVAGALAGETVRFQRRKRRRSFDEAELLEVLEPSASRIEPRCAAFGRCGGCALQHISAEEQRTIKHQTLVDSLLRIGKVEPQSWLPPVFAEAEWHYRRRARLAVKEVRGKGRVLVGFRERHAPYVTDMHRCEVLGLPVAELIDPLSELVGALSISARLPQIEVAIADNAVELIFRVLDAPTEADIALLREFGSSRQLRIALQPGNPDSIEQVWPTESPPLYYGLEDFAVQLSFAATDFVQVNASVNRLLVARAIELLEVGSTDRVIDLYCGIGNFSLPLARRAGHVIGVEGESRQVARAGLNAERNEISNAEFVCADLDQVSGEEAWLLDGCDRLLLDPARSGAAAVVAHIGRFAAQRIVYVSCHPGTLARDAGRLVHEHGYALAAAGIVDMFPHTAHVESIAVFVKN